MHTNYVCEYIWVISQTQPHYDNTKRYTYMCAAHLEMDFMKNICNEVVFDSTKFHKIINIAVE